MAKKKLSAYLIGAPSIPLGILKRTRRRTPMSPRQEAIAATLLEHIKRSIRARRERHNATADEPITPEPPKEP